MQRNILKGKGDLKTKIYLNIEYKHLIVFDCITIELYTCTN